MGAGESGSAGAVPGNDELEYLVVLVQVDRSGLIPDMGGNATTEELGHAVASALTAP